MSKIIEITKENAELLEQEGLTLIDFWAEWCGPCRAMLPVLEEFANKVENVRVVKVNVDDLNELAVKHEVRAIPTFILLKDGVFVKKITGVYPLDKLEEFCNVGEV